MTNFTRSLTPVFAVLLALPLAAQTVPATINYQGRLTDNTPSQAPLNATVNMTFEIWDAPSAGSRLWIEPNSGSTTIPVTTGIFNEEDKPAAERGFYLHPEVFDQPEEKGVDWATHPEMKIGRASCRERV